MTPDFTAQFRPLVLTVTSGLHGYRMAFVGGDRFDTIWGENMTHPIYFPTQQEAGAAYRSALLASDRLDEIARGVRAK